MLTWDRRSVHRPEHGSQMRADADGDRDPAHADDVRRTKVADELRREPQRHCGDAELEEHRTR